MTWWSLLRVWLMPECARAVSGRDSHVERRRDSHVDKGEMSAPRRVRYIRYLVNAGVVVASTLKERSAMSCALSTRRLARMDAITLMSIMAHEMSTGTALAQCGIANCATIEE